LSAILLTNQRVNARTKRKAEVANRGRVGPRESSQDTNTDKVIKALSSRY
jgi:hypothetical protein